MQIAGNYLKNFFARHWKGTAVIAVAVAIFFWPLIMNIGSYSEGGDASFNAWTLARVHHCILGEGCEKLVDGNIYFPNKDTFLYSETQLSAGLLTLPFYLLNDNPLFAYNVWTILSVFFGAWFMYLLAMRLSRGAKYGLLFSVLASLIFVFAPFKMASIFHLQNLSIFYLPLAVLLVLKFLDTNLRRYLALFFVAIALLAYASWYQIVFGMMAIGIMVLMMWLLKLMDWRKMLVILVVMGAGVATTLPLAVEFMRFAKEKNAAFSISDQVLYSSSVADYFIPHNGTLVGIAYYALNPGTHVNAYNLDSFSYHGVVLYITALALLAAGFMWFHVAKGKGKDKDAAVKKRSYLLVWVFIAIAVVGFVASLGPLLKIKGDYIYHTTGEGLAIVIPAPWLLVDKYLPQLAFIRAIGRVSVLTLFALCCLLAMAPVFLQLSKLKDKAKKIIVAVIVALIVIELMPFHQIPMAKGAYTYNMQVPAVYEFIKKRDDIDKIVILRSIEDYPAAPIPVARAEDVLWSGYHTKKIFNGYSGYTPPLYFETYWDFVFFKPDDIDKMKKLGLQYILVDKQLSTNMPLYQNIAALLPGTVYEDSRYALFKIR